MRLQSENRRQSVQSLDLSRASTTSARDKRTSFTPLTGSFNVNSGPQTVHLPDASSNAAQKSSRRISGFFGGAGLKTEHEGSSDAAELLKLRREVENVKETLEETRHELSEMREARDASETCVNALREFIAENNVGVRNIDGEEVSKALPPAPSEKEESTKASGSGGWGFNKLWKVDTTVQTPAATSNGNGSPGGYTPTPTNATANKFSRFFSRGSSVSSNETESIAEEKESPANSPDSTQSKMASSIAPSMSHRSSSDASSVVEPVSPSGESPRLGADVMVRDGSDNGSAEVNAFSNEKSMSTPIAAVPQDALVVE